MPTRFAEYDTEELLEELRAQRDLMRYGRKSRNPYYNSGPGEERLRELEEELASRGIDPKTVK